MEIDGQEEVLCDNKSVVKNSSVLISVFSKHHNEFFFHLVREVQACGMVTIKWISGKKHLEYVILKTTITGDLRYKSAQLMFYKYVEKAEDID